MMSPTTIAAAAARARATHKEQRQRKRAEAASTANEAFSIIVVQRSKQLEDFLMI